MSPHVQAQQALKAIARIRRTPAPLFLTSPHQRWYNKYTALICDFLCDELDEFELAEWEVLFTALHELVASAFGRWCHDDRSSERRAWSGLDPEDHVAIMRVLSLNPPEIDPITHAPLWTRFLRYLVHREVLTTRDVEPLCARIADMQRADRDSADHVPLQKPA